MTFFVSVFFSVIFIFPSNLANLEVCTLVKMDEDHYKLYIQDDGSAKQIPQHFVGVCDVNTLSKWNPCPFSSNDTSPTCSVNRHARQQKSCERTKVLQQPRCNCNGFAKSKPLFTSPDYPTCYLTNPCSNSECTPIIRRVRSIPLINNCIRCMTKHPNAGMVRDDSLDLKRVKRSEITAAASILGRFGNTKPNELLAETHPRIRSFPVKRTQGEHVPEKNNKKLQREIKLSEKDLALDYYSDVSLSKILSMLRYRRSHKHRQRFYKRGADKEKDEEVEDDDEDEDDSRGEDVAIEEEHNAKEATTEDLEKSELKKQHEATKKNMTKTNKEDELKQEGDEDDGSNMYNPNLLLICLVFLSIILF